MPTIHFTQTTIPVVVYPANAGFVGMTLVKLLLVGTGLCYVELPITLQNNKTGNKHC